MLHAPSCWTDHRADNIEAGAFDVIPDIFCWTKMGTEAGQPLAAILRRKELERCAGDGIFAWGIGNSLGEAPTLARQMSPSGDVEVLFTPMKSAPKAADVAPTQLLLWTHYQSRSGCRAALPEHMLVTSRGGVDKRTHYALLCQSDDPIEERQDSGAFDSTGVRNLVSMNPVGASQVTSVVRYSGSQTSTENAYRIAFKAKLYAEGFVKLIDPIPLDAELKALYEKVCAARTKDVWFSGVRSLKSAALELRRNQELQKELAFA